jgi:hypothetical protein
MKKLILFAFWAISFLSIFSCGKNEDLVPSFASTTVSHKSIILEKLPESVKKLEFTDLNNPYFIEALEKLNLSSKEVNTDLIQIWSYRNGIQIIAFTDILEQKVYHYVFNTGPLGKIPNTIFTRERNGSGASCLWTALVLLIPEPAGILDVYFAVKCYQWYNS